MRKSYPNVKAMGLFCLGSLLVCSVGGCATVPTYYWVKFGVSQEQIRKDNFFCADMTAQKSYTYPYSGERFYYAPLDQPAYRQCMVSRGYRMVSRQELEKGVLPTTPEQSMAQMMATQKLCQRVTGEEGDVNSCIRWMNFNPNRNVPPTDQFQVYDLLQQQSFRTSIGKSKTKVCLRYDPNDTNTVRMTKSNSCDSNGSESPQ
jgi:hypothetical protein